MKKFISALILFIVCLNFTNVQAATNNVIEISLDNIEEIMLEYSPELKIIENNLEKAREEYKDTIDKIDDLEDEIKDLKNKIEIVKAAPENKENINETPKEDPNKKKLEASQEELESLKDSKKAKKYDLRIARTKYDKEVRQAVMKVQKQYIDYLDTVAKKEVKLSELNTKNKQSEVSKKKYEMGFISKKEYTTNTFDTTDLKNELSQLNTKQENDLKELLLSLGLSNTEELKFNTDIKIDLDKISKINFQDDLEEMLDNNVDMQIRKIESDKLDDLDDISDYEIDNNEIYFKQEKDKAKLEFEKQYNNLKVSCDLIKNADERLKRDQYDVVIMNSKYNYGFTSKKQIEEFENELNKKESDFISQKNNLYINYLTYIQMKNGY
ncbi:viral A-type inclusion protein [Clostridium weizhouense]|uniref:Viral A-type inclusion protein n=1 Tax=Clostridium weizhouense TaxID=2859781 RepID=A0ABS7AKM7_9CLOT|nr:viral A-type inclusion protein [Clostridium weizhouense]MBW6409114.1 viral A-type inclusion protein [Clostridium weizhouense]